MLHACFSILLFMYKGKISRWIFKVVFLEMRILRIRRYVMWPTICTSIILNFKLKELLIYLILNEYEKCYFSFILHGMVM